MTSTLEFAFQHHIWATLRLIDTCQELSREQVETPVPGTYGSILQTMRHLIASDAWDVHTLLGDDRPFAYEDSDELPKLRAEMIAHAAAWSRILEERSDPSAIVQEVDPNDGYQRDGPVSIFLAAALHHGAEHRTQICTALGVLGYKPPSLHVLDFGIENGSVAEKFPTSTEMRPV